MGLDKGIEHRKEHRKKYYGAKAIDKSCRNHGSDPWSEADRLYRANKEDEKTKNEIKDYKNGRE